MADTFFCLPSFYHFSKEQRRIIAFYILPEGFSEIDEIKDRKNFHHVLESESIRITDKNMIKHIESSYYGCTTWEKIEEKFGITFRAIIKRDELPCDGCPYYGVKDAGCSKR